MAPLLADGCTESRVTQTWLLLSVAAGAAYLLVPGHPQSWLPGLPWRPLALSVAVIGGVIAWALWPPSPEQDGSSALSDRARDRWRACAVVLVLLAVLKGVLGALALTPGLPGWYFDNSRFQGVAEQSTEFRGEPWTRRERELSYGGDEFPVYFLNDVQRFNFYGAEAERRRTLPFSARWEGSLYAPAQRGYTFWLTASGPAALRVDGKQIAAVDADGRDTAEAHLELSQGAHDLRVTYARRPQRSPDLKVEWDLDGSRQAIHVPYLFPSVVSPTQWERDQALAIAAKALDGLYFALIGLMALGLVAGWARRLRDASSERWRPLERPLLGVWLLVAYARASLPSLDRLDKMTLLGGGQDWLTHESFARDILINGPLMTLGKPLGEGRTFYAQPFYPYALAAMHWLTGEDQYGVVVVQLFGLAVAGVLLYYLAKRLFGVPAALATFGVYLVLRALDLDWVSRRLISEAVYFVVLPALLLLLVRCLDERRPRDYVLAGLFLGLAIVTRGPTLLFVPFVVVVLWINLRRTSLPLSRANSRIAALLVVAGLIVALVPLRNLIVAGEPALVASSGGVNLQKLHRPTSQVRLGMAQDRWFAAYLHDAPSRETVEFILQDPDGYAASYVPLAAYTLGYGGAIDESLITVWPELVVMNLLYLGALVCLRPARSQRTLLLHAFIAIHFLTMVVFAPYDYDNRLVLPMYEPIAVFAGYALAQIALGIVERARPGAQRSPAALAEPPAS
jgi:4-amino-4-deoxy-L-arabinose transferase-like glycosyltransferase